MMNTYEFEYNFTEENTLSMAVWKDNKRVEVKSFDTEKEVIGINEYMDQLESKYHDLNVKREVINRKLQTAKEETEKKNNTIYGLMNVETGEFLYSVEYELDFFEKDQLKVTLKKDKLEMFSEIKHAEYKRNYYIDKIKNEATESIEFLNNLNENDIFNIGNYNKKYEGFNTKSIQEEMNNLVNMINNLDIVEVEKNTKKVRENLKAV